MAANEYDLAVPLSNGESIKLQEEGFRVAEKIKPSTISNQLREELIRILREGDDKNDGAFTIAVATQVEKVAVAARDVLMTEKLAKNDLAALLGARKRRKQFGGGVINGVPYAELTSDFDSGEMLQGMGGVPVANENFGVQAIKQMIEAMRSLQDSPAKLVEALASARQHGLDDVAKEIEKKLGISKPEQLEQPLPRAVQELEKGVAP